MSSIFRSYPLYIAGQKVAECSDNSEKRNTNSTLVYSTDGVAGFTLGCDETAISFGCVVPVQGMNISIDDILGVPVSLGMVRDGRLALSDGVIHSSEYKSNAKDGTSVGTFEFIGGALQFLS